jgi:hypothetical protein
MLFINGVEYAVMERLDQQDCQYDGARSLCIGHLMFIRLLGCRVIDAGRQTAFV